uniref:R3H domain-containing protein n=1 Tax=Haemonchus contortus TaxID=6289 RepID=A0A7I4YDS0_HAECO
MFKTASAVSSKGDFRTESMEMARQIAQENGYGCDGQPAWRRRRARMEHAHEEERTKVPFCVPFISDDMSAAIRARLRKADLQDSVRVVEIPPSNRKRQLVRNRLYDRRCQTPSCVICPSGKEGDCMISGVVYLITCQLRGRNM